MKLIMLCVHALVVEVFNVSTPTHTTCIHTNCEVFNDISASSNGYCLHISLNYYLQMRLKRSRLRVGKSLLLWPSATEVCLGRIGLKTKMEERLPSIKNDTGQLSMYFTKT